MEGISPPSSAISEFADAALSNAIAAMDPGWSVLRACVLGTDGGPLPALVQYALIHAHIGVALLDIVPGTTTLDAADRLRRRFDALGFRAKFGCSPPILYFCVPLRAIPDIGHLLELEFRRQPSSPLPSNDAWVATARDILSAQPLRHRASEVPGSGAGDQLLRNIPQKGRGVIGGQHSARHLRSARLLAVFWGLVTVSFGGGALFLQHLGPPTDRPRLANAVDLQLPPATAMLAATTSPPEKVGGTANAAPTSTPVAEAARDIADVVNNTPSPIENTLSAIGADPQRALIENNQAITKLQERLKRFAHAPDTGPEAGLTVLDTPNNHLSIMPATTQEQDVSSAVSNTPTGNIAILPDQASAPGTEAIAAGPGSTPLLIETMPRTSGTVLDGLPADGGPAEAISRSEANVQAPIDGGSKTAPPIAEEGVAVFQSSSPSTGAPASTGPAKSVDTLASLVTGHSLVTGTADAPRVRTPVPHSVNASMAEMMVRRADALLRHGDVSAARLLYDRVAAAGSGYAATAMGKTFDAAFLIGIGAIGVVADPAQAAMWYRRGWELGDDEARIRLQALHLAINHPNTAQDTHP